MLPRKPHAPRPIHWRRLWHLLLQDWRDKVVVNWKGLEGEYNIYIYIHCVYRAVVCFYAHMGIPYYSYHRWKWNERFLSLLSDLAGPAADGGVGDKMSLFEGVPIGSSCAEVTGEYPKPSTNGRRSGLLAFVDTNMYEPLTTTPWVLLHSNDQKSVVLHQQKVCETEGAWGLPASLQPLLLNGSKWCLMKVQMYSHHSMPT